MTEIQPYRGNISFDEPDRKVRADCGTGQWRDPDHYREWKRRWREAHRNHVREYQRLYMRRYRKEIPGHEPLNIGASVERFNLKAPIKQA